MEYIGFVFGIFGLLAYLEVSSLKKRIDALERELGGMKGTSYHEEKASLVKTVREYIGQNIEIIFKEDQADSDVISFGNSKYGSNIILDADKDWLLVRIESPKKTTEKLIRVESVERISLKHSAADKS
ncbi:MAG: hypothetical protein Q4C20_03005 [Erysipelotrichaceae bacterium]|nr:hypothetical protein [Erysipelotrichaceae bacterium]